MSRFLRDPWPWVSESVLGDAGRYDDDLGFFHVTTRVDAVRASGGLKARRDLGGIVALGGGSDSVATGHAPGLISFVYDLSRAKWLYEAIHATVRAARNEIDAVEYMRLAFEWTGFPDEWASYIDAALEDGEYDDYAIVEMNLRLAKVANACGLDDSLFGDETLVDLRQGGWLDLVNDSAELIREKLSDGRSKYEFAQDFERAIDNIATLSPGFDPSDISCATLVGFTASWAKFSQIDPDQISILQCEVREGARVDFEPAECELRFAPEDVRVVRYGVEKDGALPIDGEAAE